MKLSFKTRHLHLSMGPIYYTSF